MDISKYIELTGITPSNETLTLAQIGHTQRILENLLGYTLESDNRLDNEYTEIGKTKTDCPCPDIDMDNLDDPDDVEYAYRLFPYNKSDDYLSIDPATAVHKVKLVNEGVTFKTLEDYEYRAELKKGLIKYLEQYDCWCKCLTDCYCVQLAVDANWAVVGDDLNYVWADMVTFYSDLKKDIKSQTLGTHRYDKFDNTPPERTKSNTAILMKYAGPNGSFRVNPTI